MPPQWAPGALTGPVGDTYNRAARPLMSTDHYFSPEPGSPSRPRRIAAVLRGSPWQFATDSGVFSPGRIDPGTALLIKAMVVQPGDRVLDVGAGYGPLGLVAARLCAPDGHATLIEVNRRAAELCEQNAALNGLTNVRVICAEAFAPDDVGLYDVVLCNPPMRAGWKVVDPLLAAATACLAPGGRLWLVGRKRQGLDSLKKRLEAVLSAPETVARGGGYHVIVAGREGGDG